MIRYFGMLLLLLLTFGACQGNASYQPEAKMEGQTAAYDDLVDQSPESSLTQTNNNRNEGNAIQVARKIIKTAFLKFQVKNLKESTKKIEALSAKYEGLITSMDQRNTNYSISNNLTIRVPSEQMNAFLAEAEKESIHTNYTKINAQDVTEEFVDITSRLATKKEVRDRYVEILRKRAQTVKDILAAEDKIRVIQEEIEAIEGRLKYIQNKTALSTVTLEIYQEVAYVKAPNVYKKSFWTKLQQGFGNGWELIQDIALGLVNIWPLLLVFGLLIASRRRIKSWFKR
ncbi:MAG: DUF4349 domain-containing protein [Saprospiraceae bacterium]